jgi:hypothetical protein
MTQIGLGPATYMAYALPEGNVTRVEVEVVEGSGSIMYRLQDVCTPVLHMHIPYSILSWCFPSEARQLIGSELDCGLINWIIGLMD